MKKTYIAPAVETVKLNSPLMAISASILKADADKTIDTKNEVFSHQWEGSIFDIEEEYY